jgi:hypothetical protein
VGLHYEAWGRTLLMYSFDSLDEGFIASIMRSLRALRGTSTKPGAQAPRGGRCQLLYGLKEVGLCPAGLPITRHGAGGGRASQQLHMQAAHPKNLRGRGLSVLLLLLMQYAVYRLSTCMPHIAVEVDESRSTCQR